jgi:hypothetical protein
MNDLAMGIAVVASCDTFFLASRLLPISAANVASHHAPSMHRVGIVLGIVGWGGSVRLAGLPLPSPPPAAAECIGVHRHSAHDS